MSDESINVDRLSTRERDVLRLAALGLMDKEIVRDLSISPNTLRTYWSRIREKLGEGSRTRLAAIWLEEERRIREHDILISTPTTHRSWVYDVETRLLLVSDDIANRYGLEPGLWHHDTEFGQLIRASDRLEWLLMMERAEATGQRHFSVTHRLFAVEGPEVVHSHGQFLPGPDGKLRYLRAQTVTLQLTAIVEAMQVGLWTRNWATDEFEANAECCQIFGLDYDTFHNHRTAFLARVHPADRARAERLFAPAEGEILDSEGAFRVLVEAGQYGTVRCHVKVGSLEMTERTVSGSIIAL